MSRALVRSAAAARLPTTTTAVRAMSSSPALRDAASSTFQSPFKGESKSTKVPDFSKYLSKGSGSSNALISYFMVGTLGAISAAGAKSTVQGEFFFPGFPGGIGKGVDG
jgi:ubiquinol-cytochrome c reductase iron-sulfur subunit